MFKRFLALQWKAFTRSANFGKSLGLKIFLLLVALYLSLVFLFLGISLFSFLKKIYPDKDPLQVLNGFLLGWFILELVYRFLLQTLPVLDIKPLLTQPIARRKLVNFVLVKSLYSFFNILPLLVIIPFGLSCLLKSEHQTPEILAWMIGVYSISLSVNYFNFIIKKEFTENLRTLTPFILLVVALSILDRLGVFNISDYFAEALNFILVYPVLGLIPVFLVIVLFKWNQKHLEKKFYLDAGLREKTKAASTREFSWTRKFGDIGPFLQQDLKLIWRNKRPKTTIYLSLVFVLYGLLIYTKDVYNDIPAFYIFVGIFISGVFMINFGQFIPSWDAEYYPMIMTQNISVKQYLSSKATLISLSVVILTILATPYVYFGWKILLINIACALYNLGVNVPLLLYAGSFNRKRIDLSRSPFMNYEGVGAAQWLVGIPLIFIPVLVFYGIYRLTGVEAGVALLAFMGMAGLLLRDNLLSFLATRYKKRKYAMISGFKQTGD